MTTVFMVTHWLYRTPMAFFSTRAKAEQYIRECGGILHDGDDTPVQTYHYHIQQWAVDYDHDAVLDGWENE